MAAVGSVASLARYPVKSMLGENLYIASIRKDGILGDRAFAIIDRASGKIATAKKAREWSRLLDCRVSFLAEPILDEAIPPVRIALPNGSVAFSTEGNVDRVLSDALGREVTLMARKNELSPQKTAAGFSVPAGTFFDLGTLHVLTTATLKRLQKLYPRGRFSPQRFRPNIVIETNPDEKGFVENDWIDKTLAIGRDVRLRITKPCRRCVMTTLSQKDLPKDNGILRTTAEYNNANAGIYATVVTEGNIYIGDLVVLF